MIKSQITQAEFSELQSKLDEKGVSLDELKRQSKHKIFLHSRVLITSHYKHRFKVEERLNISSP